MNWFKHLKSSPNITPSILYDESTFYQAFFKDLESCRKEVIIESPFITSSRMEKFYPIFKRILDSQKNQQLLVSWFFHLFVTN